TVGGRRCIISGGQLADKAKSASASPIIASIFLVRCATVSFFSERQVKGRFQEVGPSGRREGAASPAGWGSVHARHSELNAAMIAGPRNSPRIPKVSNPPRIPNSTHKKGRRIAPPTSTGRTK